MNCDQKILQTNLGDKSIFGKTFFGVIPCKWSKKKGQRQKVDFF